MEHCHSPLFLRISVSTLNMLFVLFLPHLLLPRSLALLLLHRVLESLELSEIMFSNFVLLLVFAASLLKQFLQCI